MRCSTTNGWIGVTSVSPQKARIRKNPDFARFIGGSAIPCVIAAPRATFAHSPSTILGVTRTSSARGYAARYSDQLPKSITGRRA